MGQPWSRIVNSTTKNFIKEQEVNILRNRKLSAMLKSKGRISFGWSGTSMDWKIQYKRVNMVGYADGDTIDFARKDRYKTANLDWRGYSITDSMTKGEYLQNKNAQAIVSLYSNIAKELMSDIEDKFSEEFYVNGYAAGNSKRMHGIESFMSATANAGNGGASPTGSFAGLSCIPGNYGGAWNGGPTFNGLANHGWPNGKGDTQFDFWSPIIVDSGDTLFSDTPTWSANCVEALSFAIIKTKKNKSKSGQLDMFMISEEMYRQYLAVQRAKERIIVEKNDGGLRALGFTDVINQDGTDITWEYGVPPGNGYGFNCSEMEVRSQQAQLFVPEGPEFDIASKSWRFSVDFFGNTVWNPKFFAKIVNLTNPSDAS